VSDGGAALMSRGVCWSTSPSPAVTDSHTTDGSGTGVFVSYLTGLTPYSTYYVRAYAVNTIGTSYGNEKVFIAQDPVQPTVLTTSITNVTSTTASGGGDVNSDGAMPVTARGICWSMSSNPTTIDSHTTDGSGTGTFTSSLTGLVPGTLYYARAYATNSVGTAYGNEISFTTLPPFACGSPLTINHMVSGGVAPLNKSVTYGTVANIPGETSKCWITSNLGSDHQATAVNDATEASAGWYWQFNRKQGYKHDGTNRTPNSTWTTSIIENNDWQTANDPCSIELGNGWRLPTYTEWFNVDATGNWTNANGPWNSNLKIHSGGYLLNTSGSLSSRGTTGVAWSSTQNINSEGWYLNIPSNACSMFNNYKAYGFTVRCIKD
jgi:hypothetical protein